jgi:hypothetical protein
MTSLYRLRGMDDGEPDELIEKLDVQTAYARVLRRLGDTPVYWAGASSQRRWAATENVRPVS